MSKTDNFVFKGLVIVAWIIFVGLCIESGALIVNFIYSMFKTKTVWTFQVSCQITSVFECFIYACIHRTDGINTA